MYCNNPKYWDRHACAKSVDPDQMPQNVASDQGLHYLPPSQLLLDMKAGIKMNVQILGWELRHPST